MSSLLFSDSARKSKRNTATTNGEDKKVWYQPLSSLRVEVVDAPLKSWREKPYRVYRLHIHKANIGDSLRPQPPVGGQLEAQEQEQAWERVWSFHAFQVAHKCLEKDAPGLVVPLEAQFPEQGKKEHLPHGAEEIQEQLQVWLTHVISQEGVLDKCLALRLLLGPGTHVQLHDKSYTRLLLLDNGQVVAYTVFGHTTSPPNAVKHMIYCNGTPGSRLEAACLDESARAQGWRVIGWDRPGIGLSSWWEYKDYKWVGPLFLSLADAVGAEQFVLVGCSAGCQFAFVGAARLPPERCRGILSVATFADVRSAPVKKFTLPWVYRGILTRLVRRGHFFHLRLRLATLKPDTILDPSTKFQGHETLQKGKESLAISRMQVMAQNVTEMLQQHRNGILAAAHEYAWLGKKNKSWGVSFSDISPEIPIQLWHGGSDLTVPAVCSENVSRKVRNAPVHEWPGEEHVECIITHVLSGAPEFWNVVNQWL